MADRFEGNDNIPGKCLCLKAQTLRTAPRLPAGTTQIHKVPTWQLVQQYMILCAYV